jgi:hypothetical protein
MNTQTMVERLLAEGDKLGMAAAGVLLGANQGGPPIHTATVTRWCLRGVKLTNGQRVNLEHVRCGGKILTTRQAIIRFLTAQTQRPDEVDAPRTATERNRAADKATKELASMGI